MNDFDVAIIGGGPAGAAAAIPLARAGCSVLILESKPIPHDKLCGEFLSPECQTLLRALGVEAALRAQQPNAIRTARIVSADGAQWSAPLPAEAWGLSRRRMDETMLQAASAHGARVHDAEACQHVSGDLQSGFTLLARRARHEAQERYTARVVISAHGKRSTMDRALGRSFLGQRYPLFGLKRHFHGPPLGESVVLHAFDGGYCGLAEIERGVINLCFLADGRVWPRAQQRRAQTPPEAWLQHIAATNAVLGAWLREAEPCGDAWQSVGALVFGARETLSGDVLLVGDAAGLIAPLAGDGIAMALHSGLLCADQTQAFLEGRQSREALKVAYTHAWRRTFVPRMRVADVLQRLMLRPALLRPMVRAFQRVPMLGQWAIRHTRG